MSRGAGGLASRKKSGPSMSSMPTGVRSGPVSPNSPSHLSLPRTSAGNTFRGSGGGLGSSNSDWPTYPASGSRRNLSGSSSVPDVPSQRDNLSPVRATSGNWDMPVPVTTSATSPHKVEFVQKDSTSPGRNANTERQAWLASTPNSRVVSLSSDDERRPMPVITLNQDDRPSGLSLHALSTNRADSLGRDPATGRAYGNPLTPTKVTSYNPVQNFINPVVHTGGNFHGEPSDDLSNGFRGMAINDEYGQYSQTQNAMYQQPISLPTANVPSQPNPHQIPGHMVAHAAPPMPAYPTFPTQGDYGAYYPTVAPQPDYAFGYDPYYRGADTTGFGSPIVLNTTVPMFAGLRPSHPLAPHVQADMHRQFYEFNGAAPPPTQYPMAPMAFRPAAPVSPVQLTQAQYGAQMQANNKLHAQQFGLQPQCQDFSTGNRQQRRPKKPAKHGRHGQPPVQSAPFQAPMVPFANQVPSGLIGPTGTFVPGSDRRDSRQWQRPQTATIPIPPTRSALLDEFRADRKRTWQLKELFGHIMEFSADQHGSRFIQQSIESANDEERQKVFDEIFPEHILNLMQDVFGNYVIQKLFEHGTSGQQAKLCDAMIGHVFELSQHVYGCRVVQKAIDHVPRERQSAFVRELEPRVLDCVLNANGNHVIQKLVQRLASDQLGFVQRFCGHVCLLATHPYGCRVLQRCLESLSELHTRSLLDELLEHCRQLMVDQYGNYVIQYMIVHGTVMDRHFVVSGLQGHMLAMARHKFASNVVEKALLHSDRDVCRILIDELLSPLPNGGNSIQTMMKDQYANYVLQTTLSVAEGDQRAILANRVRPLLGAMRSSKSNGINNKHLTSLEKLISQAQPRSTL